VLSGRGLCDELITRPEESYRLCCVVVCDLETSRMGAPYIYGISRLRVNLDFLTNERLWVRLLIWYVTTAIDIFSILVLGLLEYSYISIILL